MRKGKIVAVALGTLLLATAGVSLGIGFRYRAEYASFDAVYEAAVRNATAPDVKDPERLFQNGGTADAASTETGNGASSSLDAGQSTGTPGVSGVSGASGVSGKEANVTPAAGKAAGDAGSTTYGQVPDSRMYGINWAALRASVPGLVGWLRTGAGADYPVVQGADDTKYLHVDAYGHPSGDGAIFMWSRNDPAWRDRITFVYGHRMTTGTMFGTNYKYMDTAYAAANPYFFVYTEEGRFRYRIVAVSSTTSASPVYAGPPAGEDGMSRWLETVRQTSQVWLSGADPEARYVVLSTCTGPSGGNQRLLVIGVIDAFFGYDGRDMDARGADAILST